MAEVIDRERAEANKRARELAEWLVETAGEQPQRFWEHVRDLAQAKLPAPIVAAKDEEMSDLDARRFERHLMPRGIHAGVRVGDVDCEYLAWWSDSDEFTRLLRKYVRSSRFRERQREN